MSYLIAVKGQHAAKQEQALPNHPANNLAVSLAIQWAVILEEIRRFANAPRSPCGVATYRAAAQCCCGGTPVSVHVTVLWHGDEPELLHVNLGEECCVDCGNVISACDYIGVYSMGWPSLPATGPNLPELYLFAAQHKKRRPEPSVIVTGPANNSPHRGHLP